MKSAREVKKLKSMLEELLVEYNSLRLEMSNKQREFSQKSKDVEHLKKLIKDIEDNKELKVSEHAIVRYFERVKGYDIKEIESQIITKKVLDMVETLGGNGIFPNEDFSVIVKNFTVTTIIK